MAPGLSASATGSPPTRRSSSRASAPWPSWRQRAGPSGRAPATALTWPRCARSPTASWTASREGRGRRAGRPPRGARPAGGRARGRRRPGRRGDGRARPGPGGAAGRRRRGAPARRARGRPRRRPAERGRRGLRRRPRSSGRRRAHRRPRPPGARDRTAARGLPGARRGHRGAPGVLGGRGPHGDRGVPSRPARRGRRAPALAAARARGLPDRRRLRRDRLAHPGGGPRRPRPPRGGRGGRGGDRVRRLRVGRISLLNMYPIYHGLERTADSMLSFTDGVPTALNAALLRDELDVSAVSSIAYARHAPELALLPVASITADGAVDSIQLFSRVPFEEVRSVAVTPHSATSVALLRILLGPGPPFEPLAEPPRAALERLDGVLLIGDEALHGVREGPGAHRTDLGGLW